MRGREKLTARAYCKSPFDIYISGPPSLWWSTLPKERASVWTKKAIEKFKSFPNIVMCARAADAFFGMICDAVLEICFGGSLELLNNYADAHFTH